MLGLIKPARRAALREERQMRLKAIPNRKARPGGPTSGPGGKERGTYLLV